MVCDLLSGIGILAIIVIVTSIITFTIDYFEDLNTKIRNNKLDTEFLKIDLKKIDQSNRDELSNVMNQLTLLEGKVFKKGLKK